MEERWDPAATLASASSPVDQSKTSAERIFDNAYRAMVDAGKDVEREVTGKIKDTAPMLRAIAREGVRLGPQGAGILLALADRIPVRPPTKQEFMHCCVQPGTEVTGPEPAPGPSGRGRGLGHVFGQSAKGSGPPSGKVGHAPSAHPAYFSVAVANSTGSSAKLVITSNPQRGWSTLAFEP